jgi:hypothetical protein
LEEFGIIVQERRFCAARALRAEVKKRGGRCYSGLLIMPAPLTIGKLYYVKNQIPVRNEKDNVIFDFVYEPALFFTGEVSKGGVRMSRRILFKDVVMFLGYKNFFHITGLSETVGGILYKDTIGYVSLLNHFELANGRKQT